MRIGSARALPALVVLVAAASLGCQLPWGQPSGPSVVITNTQIVGPQPSPGASPSPSASCPLPQSIRLGGCAQGVEVGGSCDLSLTPFLGPGVPSPASCDDLRTVEWVSTVPCTVITAGSNKYTPALKGVSVGVCKVFARVDGVRSDEISIEVRK